MEILPRIGHNNSNKTEHKWMFTYPFSDYLITTCFVYGKQNKTIPWYE